MCLTGQLLQQSHELLILKTSGYGRLVMCFLSLKLLPLWRIRGRKAVWCAPRPRVFLTFVLNICQPSLGVIRGDFVGERQAFISAAKNKEVDVAITIRKWRSSENEAKWTHSAGRWPSQLSLLFVTVTVNRSAAANASFQRWSAKVLQTILDWEIN